MSDWISVKDRLPENMQTVAFVAWSEFSDRYNGRVLGGRYDSLLDCFSIPGACFEASHWMPLPKPPEGLGCE